MEHINGKYDNYLMEVQSPAGTVKENRDLPVTVFTHLCAPESRWLGQMNIFTNSMWVWFRLTLDPQSQKYIHTWKRIRKYVCRRSEFIVVKALQIFFMDFLSHLFFESLIFYFWDIQAPFWLGVDLSYSPRIPFCFKSDSLPAIKSILTEI